MIRRSSVLAMAFLLTACSSHSGIAPTLSNVAPQIFQKQPLESPWLTTKLIRQAWPNDLAVGDKGYIWVADRGQPLLTRVDMKLGAKNFPLSIYSYAIAIGSDNNIWLSSYRGGVIARVTPSGVETDFTVGDSNTQIYSMTLGSDGAIWFSQNDSDTQSGVGRIDPFGGYTFYPMFGGAGGIVNGPDGNLWFESNFNICKMNTQGQILGRYPHSDQLYDDSAGPDGAVWFTGFNYLLRVNTNGQMTQFSAPVSGLYGITVLNGSLWMTEGGNALLSFDPVSQTFGSPIQSPENLRRIVAGQDGNFWMTGLNAAITTYVNQILTVMPSSLTLQNGKAGTLTVTETHYDGTWKAQWVGSIVNVVQTSPGVFTVTGVAPGTTKVTIEDTMHNSTRIPVTVQ